MKGYEFTEFSAKAIDTCEWYRSMLTFKREIPPGHHTENMVYWEPEEEDPQDIGA
jgi:hypothetical protein